MKVFLSRKAKKALDQISAGAKRRLETKISELLITPYPAGCRKLRGGPGAYRLRVGDCRILYVVLREDEILVFKIARREAAY